MRKIVLISAVLAALMMVASCKKEQETKPIECKYHLVNTSSHDLKVKINGEEYIAYSGSWLSRHFDSYVWFFDWDSSTGEVNTDQVPTHYLGLKPTGSMINVADSAVIEFDDGVRICYTHNDGNFVPNINNIFDPSTYTYSYNCHYNGAHSLRGLFFITDYDYLMAKKAAEESH